MQTKQFSDEPGAARSVVVEFPSGLVDSLERVGPYRRCYEIAAGPTSTVIAASQSSLAGVERVVALEILHEHLGKRLDERSGFLEQARRLSRVVHPCVCRVLDWGTAEGRTYVASELLVGEPLSTIRAALRRRTSEIPVARRARLSAAIVAELAEGLHAAHEAQDDDGRPLAIVHRDIAPRNLFLLYDGSVRVLNFGVARYEGHPLYSVSTGHLLEKLHYMAPEEVLSESCDRRVDVWGLGVVLWELVTLSGLFRGANQLEVMRGICSGSVPKLSSRAPGASSGLNAIVSRALETNPALRYQTALELAAALRSWLSVNGGAVTRADLSSFLHGFFPCPAASDPFRRSLESGIQPTRETSSETTEPHEPPPPTRPASPRARGFAPAVSIAGVLDAVDRFESNEGLVFRIAVVASPVLLLLALLLVATFAETRAGGEPTPPPTKDTASQR